MTVLFFNFAVFKLIGLWPPRSWLSSWKIACYDIYTCLVLILICTNVFSELYQSVATYDSVDVFIKDTTILITMIGNIAKASNIVNKRKYIFEMTNILVTDPFEPRDDNEKSIQKEYDKTIRSRTLRYFVIVISSLVINALTSLFNVSSHTLPYKSWYPFNVSTNPNYWLAWTHQTMAHFYGGTACAIYDTLVPGFMLQGCAKFDILNYRLGEIMKKTKCKEGKFTTQEEDEMADEIFQCVKYHLGIIEYINDIFHNVLLLQFVISAATICVTVFMLSKTKLVDPDFPVFAIYMTCMLIQLFLYCYAGNEIMLKSEEMYGTIYCNIEWYLLTARLRKYLLLIMMRSMESVKFTCGSILELSIDSYNHVVKLSYSAYSVLQQY